MDPTKINRNLVVALISLLVESITLNKLDLASKILAALRRMRPQMITEYFQFSTWILIKRGEYMEAMRELNANDDGTSQWHAMMCVCLLALNDPMWNTHADLVLAGDDEAPKWLIRGLRGQTGEPSADAAPLASIGVPPGLGTSFGRI